MVGAVVIRRVALAIAVIVILIAYTAALGVVTGEA